MLALCVYTYLSCGRNYCFTVSRLRWACSFARCELFQGVSFLLLCTCYYPIPASDASVLQLKALDGYWATAGDVSGVVLLLVYMSFDIDSLLLRISILLSKLVFYSILA